VGLAVLVIFALIQFYRNEFSVLPETEDEVLAVR
jgi:hypothetical protein